jgi:hypothetical protein
MGRISIGKTTFLIKAPPLTIDEAAFNKDCENQIQGKSPQNKNKA